MSFFLDECYIIEKGCIFKKEFTIGCEVQLCTKSGFGCRIGRLT